MMTMTVTTMMMMIPSPTTVVVKGVDEGKRNENGNENMIERRIDGSVGIVVVQ
jgi:hypothetical protein